MVSLMNECFQDGLRIVGFSFSYFLSYCFIAVNNWWQLLWPGYECPLGSIIYGARAPYLHWRWRQNDICDRLCLQEPLPSFCGNQEWKAQEGKTKCCPLTQIFHIFMEIGAVERNVSADLIVRCITCFEDSTCFSWQKIVFHPQGLSACSEGKVFSSIDSCVWMIMSVMLMEQPWLTPHK